MSEICIIQTIKDLLVCYSTIWALHWLLKVAALVDGNLGVISCMVDRNNIGPSRDNT